MSTVTFCPDLVVREFSKVPPQFTVVGFPYLFLNLFLTNVCAGFLRLPHEWIYRLWSPRAFRLSAEPFDAMDVAVSTRPLL
jgi:hypothetical protein